MSRSSPDHVTLRAEAAAGEEENELLVEDLSETDDFEREHTINLQNFDEEVENLNKV